MTRTETRAEIDDIGRRCPSLDAWGVYTFGMEEMLMILKIVQIAMLAAVAVGSCSQVASAQDIRWTHSPQQAVDIAHQSGKMILVTVGADWCHYCKKMERETWLNRSISQLVSENYVALKLTDKQHKELIAALKVQAFPTTLIFSSDRQPLARLEGYVDAEKMQEALQQIRPAYVAGQLDEDRTRIVDAHLQSCEPCRIKLSEMRKMQVNGSTRRLGARVQDLLTLNR